MDRFKLALEKSGSFGVASVLALWAAARPNVLLVRLPMKCNLFLAGGGVLIFLLRWLECRTVRPNFPEFMLPVCSCPPVKIYSLKFIVSLLV